MNTPLFFPKVIARKGKPCSGVPVRCKEVSTANHHIFILPDSKLYVPELVKMKELPGDSMVTGFIKRIGSKGTIPWPHIAIGIPCEMLDIRIICCDYCSILVDISRQD